MGTLDTKIIDVTGSFIDNNPYTINNGYFPVFQGPCEKKLSELTKPGSKIGGYLPQCDRNGKFEKKQCHWGHMGAYCWCVDPETGIEILGMTKGQSEDVQCDKTGK